GPVPSRARDAHLRAAVVASAGRQGDRDPRPVRRDADALLPGAQHPGRPARRPGRRSAARPPPPAPATRAAANAFVPGSCPMGV
ncbi:MAG: hypothetical protein AVDCRST_MAG52-701, partial [uncultured Blastococcus sp.]